jgi:hypothetical protein
MKYSHLKDFGGRFGRHLGFEAYDNSAIFLLV